MSAEAGLLADILANPDDDTPRLILADWLDDRAGAPTPRAGFIRDQVWPNPGDRDVDLLDAYLEDWCPWFGRHPELGFHRLHNYPDFTNALKVFHAGGEQTIWHRGFLERLYWVRAADWLRHADAITAAHPIREVRLTTRPWVNMVGMYLGPILLSLYGRPRRVWTHADLGLPEPPPYGPMPTPGALEAMLRAEWPGVVFTVPEEPSP